GPRLEGPSRRVGGAPLAGPLRGRFVRTGRPPRGDRGSPGGTPGTGGRRRGSSPPLRPGQGPARARRPGGPPPAGRSDGSPRGPRGEGTGGARLAPHGAP